MDMIDLTQIQKISHPDDPEGCKANCGTGKACPNKAAHLPDGTRAKYCRIHGGAKEQESFVKQGVRNYQLTKWQAQLERHSSSSNIKSLREEIGLLRMTLETRLNQCRDETDLMLNSNAISDLIVKIEKLVTSCHKIEGSMGELIDKKAILQFAQEIITILAINLTGQEELMATIATAIVSLAGRVGSIDDPEGAADGTQTPTTAS